MKVQVPRAGLGFLEWDARVSRTCGHSSALLPYSRIACQWRAQGGQLARHSVPRLIALMVKRLVQLSDFPTDGPDLGALTSIRLITTHTLFYAQQPGRCVLVVPLQLFPRILSI